MGLVNISSPEQLARVVAETAAPVVVDFWAPWCQPCKQIAPVLDAVAAEKPVTVAKVNVDEHPVLASQFGVMSVPTVVAFRDHQEAARVVGAMPKDQLLRRLGL